MRLWSNMGYLSGQNPLWGTARGDRALPPYGGAALWGARAVGPWVGEQKLLGKTPLGGNPSSEMTYLPTYVDWLPDGLCGSCLGHFVIISEGGIFAQTQKNDKKQSRALVHLF